MGMEVLAEQLIAATAVEALAAELRVVRNDTVADFEAFDLGTHSRNNTDGFMA
jgi:hypothetical protein